jgi:hypothetical protein
VAICCRCAAYPNIVAAVAQAKAQMASADDRGHDKIGATAYANLDKKGTQQKIHISRKARIVPWIGFRTALWTIAGTPWPNFTLWRQSGIHCLAESRVVAYRPLLSADQWASLLAAPADKRNLIRHASLSGEDLDLILSKRGHRNQLGFAAQICLMRFPGRALALTETPSALLHFLGDQLGVSPAVFADYARRDETRREHLIEVQAYLSLRAAAREDRRFALLAAIDAAAATDKGLPIGEAVIKSFRDRGVLLTSAEHMDRIGRAGRAIARKRAFKAILNGRTPAQLAALDALLAFDSVIRQTRFGWLGAWSDSPGAANLNGLLDRLDFLRGLAMDPACRETVHPDRWKQIVREGDAAPAWLAEDFGADRRRATLLAYLIDLQERLTDEAIHMFCKQIGRLFARAAAACEERHKSSRKETTAALRLFRDTLRGYACLPWNPCRRSFTPC